MSYVYFATAGEGRNSFCKIGFSGSHPAARIDSLRTGCPYPMELAAFVEGDLRLEKVLHETFGSIRSSGEWFQFFGRLESFVNVLKAYGNGQPVPLPVFWSAVDSVIMEPVAPADYPHDWMLWDISADEFPLQEYMETV